jgi:hypothetical protein
LSNSISDDKAMADCRPGRGEETCRYLLMGAGTGWLCGKHTELRAVLDARVEAGRMSAHGDNCEGVKP